MPFCIESNAFHEKETDQESLTVFIEQTTFCLRSENVFTTK